jgi:hypothetical protein
MEYIVVFKKILVLHISIVQFQYESNQSPQQYYLLLLEPFNLVSSLSFGWIRQHDIVIW